MNSARPVAAPSANSSCPDALQRRLAQFNRKRLKPGWIGHHWLDELREEMEVRLVEGSYVEELRQALQPQLDGLPTQADAFMDWFAELARSGPGQDDPLFRWLATTASLEQMRWFLRQDLASDCGFEDLLALAQLRQSTQPKLELARQYWDRMGRGSEEGLQETMRQRISRVLRLEASMEDIVAESLALGNLMLALAANRHYASHAIGAMATAMMSSSARNALINDGLRRLGVAAPARDYYQLHAGIDRRYAEAWQREVIRPLVEANPPVAVALAEGALLRLQAGAHCCERYRRELGVGMETMQAA